MSQLEDVFLIALISSFLNEIQQWLCDKVNLLQDLELQNLERLKKYDAKPHLKQLP